MDPLFRNLYRNRRVLVTGHTGFKGAWLSTWLLECGAEVSGYSLDPPTNPNLFELCALNNRLKDLRGDVRNFASLEDAVKTSNPEIIFHLAAQPLVLKSYESPKDTFDINVGGTVNLLEVVRKNPFVKAVVCITTDKVYENQDWIWAYRENDRLGGHDPYSSGKAMAELAIDSYRRSFFSEEGCTAVASARAGNVIGGGDYADYRLVPDCIKALMDGKTVGVRNPECVRPWQHVLEPLSGYLNLGGHLLKPGGRNFAEAWNFGPREVNGISVRKVVERIIEIWGEGEWSAESDQSAPKETAVLKINWEKVTTRLGWSPVMSWDQAVAKTTVWYKQWQQLELKSGTTTLYNHTVKQIHEYVEAARKAELDWAMDQKS